MRPSVEETTGAGDSGRRLGVAEAAEEAVGRQLGDPAAAGRARRQVLVDRFGRGVVELAQAVGVQRLVGRVQGLMGVHQIGLRPSSPSCCRTVVGSLKEERPPNHPTCRENAELFQAIAGCLT